MRQDKTDDLEILFDLDEFYEDLSEFDLPEEAPAAPVQEPGFIRPAPQPVVAAQPQPVYQQQPVPMDEPVQEQPVQYYSAQGVGAIDIRDPFIVRLEQLGPVIQSYHDQLQAHLVSYRKVKSRYSIRCDSYRSGRTLLAKMAVGGKTLKLYLALDPDDPALAAGKYHPRNVGDTKAYEDVPLMLPIRSELAVRKAMRVIDYMMSRMQIPKKRKRRPNGYKNMPDHQG